MGRRFLHRLRQSHLCRFISAIFGLRRRRLGLKRRLADYESTAFGVHEHLDHELGEGGLEWMATARSTSTISLGVSDLCIAIQVRNVGF